MNANRTITTSEELDDILRCASEKENAEKGKTDVPKTADPDYKVIEPTPFEGEPFANVVGLKNVKKELMLLVDWFKDSARLKERGIRVPKGVLLYGEPGLGKSLLIHEVIRYAGVPTILVRGEGENVVATINKVFDLARSLGEAIIVIDELDLLIDKDSKVVRSLQENLDGVEKGDNILVLTATNYCHYIPEPLRRNGRLERVIQITEPTHEDSVALLKKAFAEIGAELPPNFDEDEVGLSLSNISCAAIQAVVNDVVLRNGFHDLTMEMIDESIDNIESGGIAPRREKLHYDICAHEAGHALMMKAFPEYFTLNKLDSDDSGGYCTCREVDPGYWPYGKAIADIQISMAGHLAQKVLRLMPTTGNESDLNRARNRAYNLVNCNGYSSCWETLPPVRDGAREETPWKRRRMERKIERLLRSCERKTYRYLKSHKYELKDLAKALQQKGHLKSSEIREVLTY